MSVRFDALPGCGACASSPSSCAGLFTHWFSRREQANSTSDVTLPRLSGVSLGEPIRVEIAPRLALQLSFVAYGLPVLGLLFGALLGRLLLVWLASVEPRVWLLSAIPEALSQALPPTLAAAGFIGGLIAYKPLYAYLTGRSGTKSSPPLNASRMIVSG